MTVNAETVGPTIPAAAPRRPPERIQTPRLLLRQWIESDARQLAEAIDSSAVDLQKWTPWVVPDPREVGVLEQRVRKFRAQFESAESFVYGVFDPAEARVLGQAGLYARVGPDALEVGYWIRSDCAGQGYATEAARALLEAAFSACAVARVELRCGVHHSASQAIARRLGFRFKEIVPEDMYADFGASQQLAVFELTSSDYFSSQALT
ncbi:MAG TPA: GNAT family N-acetyltransferase [Longimicrobiales bacterium]|nr:GNAT family N-acetyltransferase [Longimicrobiales bacterium]